MTRKRTNDDLGTPKWFLDLVRQVGPIALDPCSNPWSLVRAKVALDGTRGRCGLSRPWAAHIDPGTGLVFWNPVYSRPKPFCERAVESKGHGLESIGLLRHDPSTQWSKLLRKHANARCDLDERVAFEGGQYESGQIPNSVWYMGPRPYLFAHVFAPYGEVRVLDDSPYARAS